MRYFRPSKRGLTRAMQHTRGRTAPLHFVGKARTVSGWHPHSSTPGSVHAHYRRSGRPAYAAPAVPGIDPCYILLLRPSSSDRYHHRWDALAHPNQSKWFVSTNSRWQRKSERGLTHGPVPLFSPKGEISNRYRSTSIALMPAASPGAFKDGGIPIMGECPSRCIVGRSRHVEDTGEPAEQLLPTRDGALHRRTKLLHCQDGATRA
jgi:hypothetical protein